MKFLRPFSPYRRFKKGPVGQLSVTSERICTKDWLTA